VTITQAIVKPTSNFTKEKQTLISSSIGFQISNNFQTINQSDSASYSHTSTHFTLRFHETIGFINSQHLFPEVRVTNLSYVDK